MPTRSPFGSVVKTLLTGASLATLVGRSVVGERQRASATRASPPSGSRLMTSTVSSPAMQPRAALSSALSSAEARNCAAPGGVRSTTRLADASALTSSSAASRASRCSPFAESAAGPRRAVAALAGHGVDQHARGVADPDGVELDEVARQRRLRDVQARGRPAASASSACERTAWWPSRSMIRWCRAALVVSTPVSASSVASSRLGAAAR